MPLIEELPVTTTQRTTQGWAYVPDIAPQVQPVEGRKRGTRNQPLSIGEHSAKQQKAIQTKLNELDKENYKDTTIPIPAKSKARRAGKKVTPNVRRILTYQRTFAHYLADEEAQLAQSGNSNTVPTLPQTPTPARAESSRASRTKQTPMQPPPRPGPSRRTPATSPAATSTSTPALKRQQSASASTGTPSAPQRTDLDLSTANSPQTHATINPPNTDSPAQATQASPLPPSSALSDDDDSDPLLRSRPALKLPSDHILQCLISEPPLSYSASRAQPLEDSNLNNMNINEKTTTSGLRLAAKPKRHFCSICGYWGKVKCKGCGERTCGLLECWNSHEGICSVPT